jgi:hypothetical protein
MDFKAFPGKKTGISALAASQFEDFVFPFFFKKSCCFSGRITWFIPKSGTVISIRLFPVGLLFVDYLVNASSSK